MQVMDAREQTVANIQQAVADGDLNRKVEPGDPSLDAARRLELCTRAIERRGTASYRLKNAVARTIANCATAMANRRTRIEGIERIRGLEGGAVVTSNHFSPIDNTVVRHTLRRVGKRTMPVVCQDANLAMPGLFGFLMNYVDTIPLTTNPRYLRQCFEPLLKRHLENGDYVLIYPEQEMWFNYRKPRPCKRGAYHYAASFNVPVISCFVEIIDKPGRRSPNYVEVSYVMHVLDPIFPDPGQSVRANSVAMGERDYAQKKEAYERAYGVPLDYAFDPGDIAGWVPPHGAEAPTARASAEVKDVGIGLAHPYRL